MYPRLHACTHTTRRPFVRSFVRSFSRSASVLACLGLTVAVGVAVAAFRVDPDNSYPWRACVRACVWSAQCCSYFSVLLLQPFAGRNLHHAPCHHNADHDQQHRQHQPQRQHHRHQRQQHQLCRLLERVGRLLANVRVRHPWEDIHVADVIIDEGQRGQQLRR